jgi:hypothetical protein
MISKNPKSLIGFGLKVFNTIVVNRSPTPSTFCTNFPPCFPNFLYGWRHLFCFLKCVIARPDPRATTTALGQRVRNNSKMMGGCED